MKIIWVNVFENTPSADTENSLFYSWPSRYNRWEK